MKGTLCSEQGDQLLEVNLALRLIESASGPHTKAPEEAGIRSGNTIRRSEHQNLIESKMIKFIWKYITAGSLLPRIKRGFSKKRMKSVNKNQFKSGKNKDFKKTKSK